MKRFIPLMLLCAPLYGASVDLNVTGGLSSSDSISIKGLNITNAGNSVSASSITMRTDVTGATETYASHEQVYYAGTNPWELPAGRWMDFYYNQSSTYPYSSTLGSETAHGIGLFSRLHGNIGNQGFMAAIEGNTLCTSTYTSAACVGLIAHTKYDSPTMVGANGLLVGVDSRIDITSDGFGTVALASGTVVHFRPDPGSIGGKAGMRFSMYTTDPDLQIMNAGNIIKIPPASQVVSTGTTVNTTGACGGVLILTSTTPVTTGANAFTAPSSNETDGTYNNGCEITVINGNLVAGRSIIFKASGSRFLTTTATDITVGALGGSFRIASFPEASVWVQTTTATK